MIETAKHRICAAVLAGGKARRMGGIPKGTMQTPDGYCIMQRLIIELYKTGVEETVIVANNPIPYLHFGVRIIPDTRINIGPLGGIETALQYFNDRCCAVLFMPCDLPAIAETEISLLVKTFRETDNPIVFAVTRDLTEHPLCVIVQANLLEEISSAIDSGIRNVGFLWSQLGAGTVYFDDINAFINLNSPGDMNILVPKHY